MRYIAHLTKQVFSLFDDLIREKKSVETPHRADIRASSLPICWADVTLTAMAKKAGRVPTKEWHLGSALYTAIGNGVHAVAQQYLGYVGVLYGSWECLECGKVWVNQTCPGICCNSLPDYLEYTLHHPDPYIAEFGHCDGVLVLPFGLGWCVVEFKTTGESMAVSRRAKGPAEEHKKQASAYHYMFKKGYSIVRKKGQPTPEHPRGPVLWEKPAVMPPGKQLPLIVIVYIKRDKPKPAYWLPFVIRPIKDVMEDVEANAEAALTGVETGVVPKGVCVKFDDARNPYNRREICPWAKRVCFSTDPAEAIEQLHHQASRPAKRQVVVDPTGDGDFIPRKGRSG